MDRHDVEQQNRDYSLLFFLSIISICIAISSLILSACLCYRNRQQTRDLTYLLEFMANTSTEFAHIKYVLLENADTQLKLRLAATMESSPRFHLPSSTPEERCPTATRACLSSFVPQFIRCFLPSRDRNNSNIDMETSSTTLRLTSRTGNAQSSTQSYYTIQSEMDARRTTSTKDLHRDRNLRNNPFLDCEQL